MPQTQSGKYAVGLIISFAVCFAIFAAFVASGQRGGAGFFDNLWLTIPFLAAALSAVASFLISLVSIVRDSERAVTVFIALIVGFFVTLFVGAELAFPH